jgi:LPXTG-site transpeptidase (sortase) family protein
MTHRVKIIAIGMAVVAAGFIFATTAVRSMWYAPEPQAPASTTAALTAASKPVSPGDGPARLIIPSLAINAGVQYLGINAKGNMMAPSNFTDVGWYKFGPAPGQDGSAVIDGHVDNGLGLAGVFKYLDNISVGDDIYVQTKKGTKLHFVVSDVESYPYTDAPSATIFSRKGNPTLTLITCEGVWVRGGDTYDHRLVIFSTLAS